MDVLTLQKLKNHRVESGFFADFEPFWMSKNDKLDLQILGQIPTESWKYGQGGALGLSTYARIGSSWEIGRYVK